MAAKSLLIGSNGYIGKNLAWYLTQKGEELTCYDIAPKSTETWMNYHSLDLTNKQQVEQLDVNCDFIYLFAGLTGTSQGFDEYETYHQVNVIGLTHLLNHMKNNHSKARLVFPSTRLVYKGKENTPLQENDEKEAKTIYALNKITCEFLLETYANAYQISYTIFRICVPYGHILPDSYSYGTIGFFVSKAKKGEPISLYGDGELKRTFTHVADLCTAIVKAIQLSSTNRGIYNIGGENFSLKEVAQYIAKVYQGSLAYIPWPAMAWQLESGDTIFDSSKLEQEIGNYLQHSIKNTTL